MNRELSFATSASSEALFGSAARGDADTLSDRDILIVDDDVSVLQRRAAELATAGWSVASYTFSKFDALCSRGALFVQHIKLESKTLVDRDGRLSGKLAAFQPRQRYEQEIRDNDALAGLVGLVPHGSRGMLLAADILYVTVRNFGVLTLAERGIHAYAFSEVISTLELEGLLPPGGACALAALRFLKCLYRSGETVSGNRTRSAMQEALGVLPKDHFPNEVRAVSPEDILRSPAPFPSMPAYFHLRDLERRLVALQTFDRSFVGEQQFQELSRWIENPRAYAGQSARLAPHFRDLMKRQVDFQKRVSR